MGRPEWVKSGCFFVANLAGGAALHPTIRLGRSSKRLLGLLMDRLTSTRGIVELIIKRQVLKTLAET
jgi:hypothetical protein